eukprot:COSAG06_NODE_36586_length_445_cov_0.893064_1_plen_89_part_01
MAPNQEWVFLSRPQLWRVELSFFEVWHTIAPPGSTPDRAATYWLGQSAFGVRGASSGGVEMERLFLTMPFDASKLMTILPRQARDKGLV